MTREMTPPRSSLGMLSSSLNRLFSTLDNAFHNAADRLDIDQIIAKATRGINGFDWDSCNPMIQLFFGEKGLLGLDAGTDGGPGRVTIRTDRVSNRVGVHVKPKVINELVLPLVPINRCFGRDGVLNGDLMRLLGFLLREGVFRMAVFDGQANEGIPLLNHFARFLPIPNGQTNRHLTGISGGSVLEISDRDDVVPNDASEKNLSLDIERGGVLLEKSERGPVDKGGEVRRRQEAPSERFEERVVRDDHGDAILDGWSLVIKYDEKGRGTCTLARKGVEMELLDMHIWERAREHLWELFIAPIPVETRLLLSCE